MAELLTDAEHHAMDLTVELWNTLARDVVGDTSGSRKADLRELAAHLHAIQQAVLSQAAGRAYPGRYRLLGRPLVEAPREPVVVWACPEPGCDFRLNRAGDDDDAAAWDARVLLGARERHNAERHLSAKAVFEKLNALPARDRATARWVMSWATLESLCALHARPKPIPGAAVTLVGLPVDIVTTAVGLELRSAPPPESVVPHR